MNQYEAAQEIVAAVPVPVKEVVAATDMKEPFAIITDLHRYSEFGKAQMLKNYQA